MSKKERQFFFAPCYFIYVQQKLAENHLKIFHARERPWFQENFYLQIKNPPTSKMVKRWRPNADLDLLLLPSFL